MTAENHPFGPFPTQGQAIRNAENAARDSVRSAMARAYEEQYLGINIAVEDVFADLVSGANTPQNARLAARDVFAVLSIVADRGDILNATMRAKQTGVDESDTLTAVATGIIRGVVSAAVAEEWPVGPVFPDDVERFINAAAPATAQMSLSRSQNALGL